MGRSGVDYNTMMMEATLLQKFKDRYQKVHPLIFLRSVERAKSNGDLFDILEGFPNKYPVVWDEDHRCWAVSDDLLQSRRFEENAAG